MKKGSFGLMAVLVLLAVIIFPAAAQNSIEETCALFVLDVQAQIEALCPLGEGACYIHAPVTFEALPEAEATFAAPGDRVPLSAIKSIHTGPLKLAAGEWGLVALDVPPAVDEPETEPARFLLMGDVTLNRIGDDETLPAFSVRTAAAEPECSGAPNKLLLKTPAGSTLDLAVNGAAVHLNEETAIVLDALPYEKLTLLVVTGEITVAAEGETQTVSAGQQTVIVLGGDNGLVVVSVPSLPEPFDFALLQFLPLHEVIQEVELPSADRWTATGVSLTAGQSYLVIGSGLVKTIEYMPWAAPGGHTPDDCAAAGRGDWDCKCRTLPDWGTCSLNETSSMTLLGNIDGGAPFVVGAGGFFTAAADGELYLGANDNTFTDNVGSYHAIIIPIGSEE